MPTDDSPDPQPLGFNLDIGEILRAATAPKPKRKPARRRTTAGSSTTSNDMDAAMRRAVRAELVDVGKALKALATEIVRLRRANEALAAKVDRLSRR